MSEQGEIVSVDMSADPKENAFYHYCAKVGHFKAYAICCHLMTERKEGRLDSKYEDCSVAISQKTCPAIAKRKLEMDKGRAMYFVPRSENQRKIMAKEESYVKMTAERTVAVQSKRDRAERAGSPVVATRGFEATGYAEAISLAVRDAVENSKTISPSAAPGESMMDFAKRMLKGEHNADV